MSTLTINIKSDEGRIRSITKDVPTKHSFFQSFLLLDAIANLIEGADTGGWQNHPQELQPDEFYNGVLSAVASLVAHDDYTPLPNLTSYDVLKTLIDHLHGLGYLKKQLTDENGEAYCDDD